MSDSKSVLPKSPKDVIVEALNDLRHIPVLSNEYIADMILMGFEANDIDVTWRPAEQALGTMGDGE